MPASDKAAQRKITINVFACRCLGIALKALLDVLGGLKRNQPFMLAGAKSVALLGGFNITGISHAGEYICNRLVTDFTGTPVFREFREAFKKAFDFGLDLKTPGSIAFQSFFYKETQNGCFKT